MECFECGRKFSGDAQGNPPVQIKLAEGADKAILQLLAAASVLALSAHNVLRAGKADAQSIIDDLGHAKSALADALDHVRWLQQRAKGSPSSTRPAPAPARVLVHFRIAKGIGVRYCERTSGRDTRDASRVTCPKCADEIAKRAGAPS